MPTLAEKAGRAMTPSTRALDPVERASEAIFGVLMAVSIMGALSVTSEGPMDARATLLMAIGCNIAWGFTDAVMYLVSTATVNSRNLRLVRRLQTTTDIREARLIVADALPERVAAGARDETIEALRKDLCSLPVPTSALEGRDFLGALGVFLIVVLATFPVVFPFLFLKDVRTAGRASDGLALAVLYGYGHVLGRYTGGTPWKYGLAIAALGAGLVAVIMVLGG
jgi:VIT1/CCC1 family predicted Fe2+/Mn2+ transporter